MARLATRRVRCPWLMGLPLALGCARGTALQGQIEGAQDIVAEAERSGAYRCAPRELALAKAHLAFAHVELLQGNASRAEAHLVVGVPNAKVARSLSEPARCLGAESFVPESDLATRAIGVCSEGSAGALDGDGCGSVFDTDGDGIPDAVDACVAEREDFDGYLDQDGCPELDNDLDGIVDARDQCPMDPEDLDGFQDADGCPDLDNDGDGILDTVDQCPNEPGSVASMGCPETYAGIEIAPKAIRLQQPVQFVGTSAELVEASRAQLAGVAKVLRDQPGITLEVQGHTDSQGDEQFNLRVSQQRAEAVRQFLVAQGIEPARLTAQGYGETRPIESNRTSRGRALNRRIELVRTDTGAAEEHAGEP